MIIVVDGGHFVEKVAETFKALAERGALDSVFERMAWAHDERQKHGKSDCHGIAYELFWCLDSNGEKGWVLRMGRFSGNGLHSWLEKGKVALAGDEEADGAPVLRIELKDSYRQKIKARVYWTFVSEARDHVHGELTQDQ